jgi:DNA-binding MarR family transcriptional regulator
MSDQQRQVGFVLFFICPDIAAGQADEDIAGTLKITTLNYPLIPAHEDTFMTADASSTAPGNCDALLLDNQLCFALYSTSLLMTKVYKPLLQALGLTYPQYLAMMVLWEQDGITVGEISNRLLTDPGSLTPLLKRLEGEGLLNRTRSKQDERVVQLRLTEQGRALQHKALSVPGCILTSSGLDLEQLQALQGDLLKLRANLQDSV